MDDAFDVWTRTLATRRRGLSALALPAVLATLAGDRAAAAAELRANVCSPDGVPCGRRRGGKTARRRCQRCCSKCTSGRRVGKLRCSCCPVGARCRRHAQCCSGSCRGRRCVVDDPGASPPATCSGPTGMCAPNRNQCGGSSQCACTTTLAGATGCFATGFVCYPNRTTCTVDADCLGSFGAGFACVSTAGCNSQCGGNRNACVATCPSA